MKRTARPTIRSIARALRISRTTVSEALRNNPRVNERTRARVQAAADNVGYRSNPLASSILSDVRRTRLSRFQGVLAVVSVVEPARPKFLGPYWRDLLCGAEERGAALGFKLERFFVGEPGVSVQRLNTILRSRGIHGLMIAPMWGSFDFTQLDWTHYTGVYADYLINQPALHSVCSDHPRSMMSAMAQLRRLGYRRPGLVLQDQESRRLQHRWAAAFLANVQLDGGLEAVPPLIVPKVGAEAFNPWFKRYNPDVVLGHSAEIISWMTALGSRVPKSHGFCCLNVSLNSTPCAGIDQQPYHIGLRAIEIVINQLHRNEYGIPVVPCNTTVPSRWIEGPTLPTLARKSHAM